MKALFQAIRQGNEGQIHKLVADGANLNAFDPGTQKTPLIYAIASGNKVSVRLLLELGAHPNLVCQVDEEPRTPLSEACARGNEAIARLLVEHGADIHWQEGQHRRSMMHWAAQGGGVWIVERLLQEGITIDIQDAYGGTPLHEAVRNGHHELCQLLLARGAHINARLHSGPSAHMTPLSLALKMGFPKIVALLLQSGAQIDPAVFLSLLQLTERPKDLTEEQQKYIARLILAHGQQSDIAPAFTKKPYVVSVRTALEYCTEVHAEVRRAARMLLTDCALSDLEQALLAGERHKVEELLEQVVFQEIEANRKLLFDAITSGSPAIVQHFLARGMNANTADPETGETLLHRAVKLNQWEIVHLLLKAGANVNVSLNIRDRRGTPVSPPETPLAMALKYADERMLRLLLKAGAQVNPERRNDWVREYGAAVFPLHQTSNSQHIRLLLDVGANPNLALEYALEQRVAPRRYAQSRLEMAVEQDEIEVASILLEHRARFRSGSQGGSLLYHALKNRSLDMLDLLLAHHAQPIGSQDLPPNLPPHMLQRLTRAGIALPKRREYAKLDAANCTYAGNLQRTGEFQAQGLTNFHDIRWSFATAGHIYVPPLAGHDSIYVGSNDGILSALDTRTGNRRWHFETPSAQVFAEKPEAWEREENFSTPDSWEVVGISSMFLHGTMIYLATGMGMIYGLDVRTGKPTWQLNLIDIEEDFAQKYNSSGTKTQGDSFEIALSERSLVISSLMIIDSILVFSAHYSTYAVDLATRSLLWKEHGGEALVHQPWSVYNQMLFGLVPADNNGMKCLEVYDLCERQESVWGDIEANGLHELYTEGVVPIADGIVFLTTHDRLRAFDVLTGEALWSVSVPDSDYLAIANGMVYSVSVSGKVWSLDTRSLQMRWEHQLQLSERYQSYDVPPSYANDMLYVGRSDGLITALDAHSGGIQWSCKLEGIVTVPCTITDKAVCVAAGKKIYALY